MLRRMLLTVGLAAVSVSAWAVPTLQVGAPGGPGEGTYADYIANLSNPTESETAVTDGTKLYIAAAFGPNDIFIGGKYTPVPPLPNWSNFGFDSIFNVHSVGGVVVTGGAVLMATVPGGGVGSVMVNGVSPFFTSTVFESGFIMPNPPSDHDPVNEMGGGDNTYLFFDVGNLFKVGTVPDFATETGGAPGEVEELTIAITGYDWVHFDLFALVTSLNGNGYSTALVGNPGSHDVTWKVDGGGPPSEAPEPGTLLLLGSALAALGLRRRQRH